MRNGTIAAAKLDLGERGGEETLKKREDKIILFSGFYIREFDWDEIRN